MNQFKKDRIKEVIIGIIVTLGAVGGFLILMVVLPLMKTDIGGMCVLLSLAVWPLVVYFVCYAIAKTIKTSKKTKRNLTFIEYSVYNGCDIKEKMSNLGIVKQSKYRESDYYVTFVSKCLFAKEIVVIAHIEVDSNYTQQDYNQFIRSIPELEYSTRINVNEDYTNYDGETLIVIFSQKEPNKFVDGYIVRDFGSRNKFYNRIYVLSVYDEKNLTVKFVKKEWGFADNYAAKKYLNKIFSFTDKPRIIKVNKNKK